MSVLGHNAGSAYITVRPSLRGWEADVKRQLARELKNVPALQVPVEAKDAAKAGQKAGDDFSGGFDRLVRTRIRKTLEELPDAKIGADMSAAEVKVQALRGELEALSEVRIGVDVDAAAATARVEEIRAQLVQLAHESPTIDVQANTLRAAAELGAIQAEISRINHERAEVTVDVDKSGVSRMTEALDGLSGMASGATSRIALLATAGLALIPVAAVLSTIAATATGVLVAGGGGLGVLLASVLGNILPVIKAQSELKQKQQEAATAASSYATAQNGVRTAVQGLANAEIDAARAVADAKRNAARSIQSAEEAVAAAQRSARDAQEALNQARVDAREKLAAYALQLRGAALDERGAALSVTQAQEALNAVLSDPAATQLQIDLARQALAEARLGYADAQQRRGNLRKQAEKDRKAGVEGDKSVKAARERLAEARRAEADAERRLSQARGDAARNIARAQADGARQVAAAQAAVAQAQQVAAEAGARSAAAQAEVAKRLAKLSGPAAVFVKALSGAKAAWQGFLKATGQASFGLAIQALHLFVRLLPQLEPLARRSARAVGVLLRDFDKFANGREGQGFLRWMERQAPRAIVTIGRAIGNIVRGIGGLVGALFDTDTGFSHLMRRFAAFGRAAGQNSTVRAFFDYTQRMAPLVGAAIGAIVDALVAIVTAAAPVATFVVKAITDLAHVISGLDPSIITAIVGGLVAMQVALPIVAGLLAILEASPVILVTAALIALGAEIFLVYKKVRFFHDGINRTWKAVASVVEWAWKNVIKPVFEALSTFVTKVLVPVIEFLWSKVVKPYFTLIGDFIKGWWERVIHPAFQAFWYLISHTLIPIVKYLWDKVVHPIFSAMVDFFRDTVVPRLQAAGDAIAKIWNAIASRAVAPIQFIVDVIYNNGLRKVINAIPGVTDVGPLTLPSLPQFGGSNRPAGSGTTPHGAPLPGQGFAGGGVLPGWTPGRDVHRFVSPTAGILNLSGGEAVMRPEFTAAAGGPAGIAILNRLARAGRLHGLLGRILTQSHRAGGVIYVDGEPLTRVAAAQLAVAEHASGIPMRVIQGSYQPATSYSGTSHTGGGVMDTSPGSFAAQAWLRRVAFAAWARNIPGAAYAGSGAHVHSVSLIDPTVTNTSQVASYRAGGDGLGGGDYGPRPAVSAALLRQVSALVGGSFSGAAVTGAAGVRGGNPLTRFLSAIDTVKTFATAVPQLLARLGRMDMWGPLLLTGVKTLGGHFRAWVNGKIPGPGPLPDVFDSGGLAFGRGFLRKDTLAPERVLSPAQTAAFERQVATLDNWDRTVRAMAGAQPGPDAAPRLQVERFRIVDWDKGLAEIEYLVSGAAEQVYARLEHHRDTVDSLSTPY